MNAIEILKDQIARELPEATLRLEAPTPPKTSAAWWLEAELGGHEVVVEWKPKRGFGVTSPAEGFGEGADEVHEDPESTARRVVELLRKRERTTPPIEAALAKLRKSLDISQEKLAAALNIRQGAVSKMERRPLDILHVSTLRKAIAAMGGELEILARFSDRVVRIGDASEGKNPLS